MADSTKIEWCDSTFNPWIGCTRVSPACDDCYAARSTPARALGVAWGPREPRRRTSEANWKLPLRWESQHEAFATQYGRRRRVFCASLADVFDNAVPPEWRQDLFELIRLTPHLDWLLLTKRPQNIVRMVNDHGAIAGNGTCYLPANVWLGTTVEDQQRADQNIPALLRTIGEIGACTLFLSCEPMLGPVDVFDHLTGELLHTSGNGYEPGFINWVICGGESGPQARPMQTAWARSLRDQCDAAGVPFLFKQWGEWLGEHQDGSDQHEPMELNTTDHPVRVGKKAAGRHLDGSLHDGFPQTISSKAPRRANTMEYSAIRARASRWAREKGLAWNKAFDLSAQQEGYDNALHLIKVAITCDPAAVKEWWARPSTRARYGLGEKT